MRYEHSLLCLLAMLTTAGCSGDRGAGRVSPAAQPHLIASSPDVLTAYVPYFDTALVLTGPGATAVIDFTEPIDQGVGYRYRVRTRGISGERSGEGAVYERYDSRPAVDPASGKPSTELTDAGGSLFIRAGPLWVEWSHAGDDSGYIYYIPEQCQVMILSEDHFDDVDLHRFSR